MTKQQEYKFTGILLLIIGLNSTDKYVCWLCLIIGGLNCVGYIIDKFKNS